MLIGITSQYKGVSYHLNLLRYMIGRLKLVDTTYSSLTDLETVNLEYR